MKTVTSTLLLASLALGAPVLATPKVPDAKLLDMYAMKEGDSYVVHILADGDISEFLSERKESEGTYKLTLDVPALSPLDTKYDVETPFSRRFQVWPMQLGKQIYSRVEMELDIDASSVVGVLNTSHLFVRIQRESTASVASPTAPPTPEETSPPAVADDMTPVAITPLGVLPVEPLPTEDSDEPRPGGSSVVDDSSEEPGTEELFFNLFPTPVGDQQTLFNVAPIEDLVPSEAVPGIRVGRFALQPSVDASYVRGSNLLLLNQDTFEDTALLVRGRVVAVLLDSVNEFKIAYEGRYRQFDEFNLENKFSSFFDVDAKLMMTPSSSIQVQNHFVRAAFENQEFDVGGEVVASVDPFFRNRTKGVFAFEFSERLGGELTGTFNRVEFLEPESAFFNYDTTEVGAAVLYNLSPLTSLVGEYLRISTRPDPTRPSAESNGHVVLFGVRGELTPLTRGRIRVGYAQQNFERSLVPTDYRGLIADATITRQFGETTALDITGGRRTNPSAFENNGFYTSNYGSVRFVMPITGKLRLSTNGILFKNSYPLENLLSNLSRKDTTVSGAFGVAYFWAPLSFFSVDVRHDRRNSNLEQFSYRNNAVQFMVGFGFLNR